MRVCMWTMETKKEREKKGLETRLVWGIYGVYLPYWFIPLKRLFWREWKRGKNSPPLAMDIDNPCVREFSFPPLPLLSIPFILNMTDTLTASGILFIPSSRLRLICLSWFPSRYSLIHIIHVILHHIHLWCPGIGEKEKKGLFEHYFAPFCLLLSILKLILEYILAA